MNSPHDELCPPPSADDDDLTLPRASINKMIKELVSVSEQEKINNDKTIKSIFRKKSIQNTNG